MGRSIIVTLVLALAAAFVLASGSGCAKARPDPTEAPQRTPTATVQISPLRATATAKALSRTRQGRSGQGQSGQGQSGSDLDQMLRDIREIERWVTANTGNLSRCIESGRIDWSRYATSLEVSAIVLTEAGLDWADGSADSYTPYEVQRSVTVLQENIRELKSKCGLSN